MSNAAYGGTMENLRNRIIDVKLLSIEKGYLKWTSKQSYSLALICKRKATLILSKLAYAPVCILDLSKVLMYKFHYDYIKNKYGNNSRLLFTDTDRFDIWTENWRYFEDFNKDKEMCDFSNYSAKLKHHDSKKLVIGKMRDETAGVAIKEFAELKPRMYSFFARW